MEVETKAKLEIEAALGERYQRAWEELVQPFFIAKQEELFEGFLRLPPTAKDELVTLKMQSNALKSLENEFQHHINTGIMAQKTLIEDDQNESSN